MVYQSEMQKLTKRELFERCKELNEAIEDLVEYDPVDRDDENQNVGAYFSCVHEFNQHFYLLLSRVFRKHKIFRAI